MSAEWRLYNKDLDERASLRKLNIEYTGRIIGQWDNREGWDDEDNGYNISSRKTGMTRMLGMRENHESISPIPNTTVQQYTYCIYIQ